MKCNKNEQQPAAVDVIVLNKHNPHAEKHPVRTTSASATGCWFIRLSLSASHFPPAGQTDN